MILIDIKDKEEILKNCKKKKTQKTIVIYKATSPKARSEWNFIFKVLKEKKLAKNSLSSKLIFQKWKRNRNFPRQTKAEEIHPH